MLFCHYWLVPAGQAIIPALRQATGTNQSAPWGDNYTTTVQLSLFRTHYAPVATIERMLLSVLLTGVVLVVLLKMVEIVYNEQRKRSRSICTPKPRAIAIMPPRANSRIGIVYTVTGPSPAEGSFSRPRVLLGGEVAQVPHFAFTDDFPGGNGISTAPDPQRSGRVVMLDMLDMLYYSRICIPRQLALLQ